MRRLKGGRSVAGCCFFRSCSDGTELTEKMQSPSQNESSSPGLIRGMGLGSATALNMIDMIGVGPFITMPLVLSAMGGPQAMLGWVVGALLAVCDGLVSAELGAALPGSGGPVSLPERDLWSAEMGAADFVSVYLAAFLQRAAFDCHGMYRAGRLRCLLLARPGDGIRRTQLRRCPSPGRDHCR